MYIGHFFNFTLGHDETEKLGVILDKSSLYNITILCNENESITSGIVLFGNNGKSEEHKFSKNVYKLLVTGYEDMYLKLSNLATKPNGNTTKTYSLIINQIKHKTLIIEFHIILSLFCLILVAFVCLALILLRKSRKSRRNTLKKNLFDKEVQTSQEYFVASSPIKKTLQYIKQEESSNYESCSEIFQENENILVEDPTNLYKSPKLEIAMPHFTKRYGLNTESCTEENKISLEDSIIECKPPEFLEDSIIVCKTPELEREKIFYYSKNISSRHNSPSKGKNLKTKSDSELLESKSTSKDENVIDQTPKIEKKLNISFVDISPFGY